MSSDLLKGLAAFVVVVGVVVGGAALAGAATSGPTDRTSQPNAPAFDVDSLLPTPVDDGGSIDPPSGADPKTIVVDTSHGNAVTNGDIQPLVDALTAAGHEVRLSGSGGASPVVGPTGSGGGLNETLRSADALVVVSPRTAYTPAEVNGVEAFADAGGRVLLLADPVGQSTSGTSGIPLIGSTATTTTSGQPTNLAARFDISFGSDYLYDMGENANNFRSVYASPDADGPLTADVSRTVFRDAAALTTGPNASRLLTTEARRSASRRGGTYAVAARAGNVTAVGDTDFLEPATATVADNDRFVSNLLEFVSSGEAPDGVPEPPEESPGSALPGSGGGISPPAPELPGNTTTPGAPENGTDGGADNGTAS